MVGHHFAATLAANIRNHYHRGRLWAELFLGRPAFDNYLTNRRHGLSRLLLVVGSTALVGAVAGAGTVWPIAALSAFVINAWLTRDLYRLAFGKGGVLFAGGVSLAEILLSWILLGAGFRACLRAIVVAVGGRRPVD